MGDAKRREDVWRAADLVAVLVRNPNHRIGAQVRRKLRYQVVVSVEADRRAAGPVRRVAGVVRARAGLRSVDRLVPRALGSDVVRWTGSGWPVPHGG
jgi:hypothetical protein